MVAGRQVAVLDESTGKKEVWDRVLVVQTSAAQHQSDQRTNVSCWRASLMHRGRPFPPPPPPLFPLPALTATPQAPAAATRPSSSASTYARTPRRRRLRDSSG